MKSKLIVSAVATPQRVMQELPAEGVLQDGMAGPHDETIPAHLSTGLESQGLVS